MKERRGPGGAARGLEDEVALFKKRTRGSARAYERARRWTVYGVHSNYRVLDPYPLYARRAKGARIWDVDGNAYLDFSMAFGALVAGHSHPTLVAAMRERVANGTIFGFEGEETEKVCGLLCKRFRVDRVKLSNTGMDATMYAMRFARAATGRKGILKFEGCYHGSHDALMAGIKPTREKAGDPRRPNVVPASTGLTPGAQEFTYVAPFNDLAATEAIAEARADEMAAIILEPIPMNMGFVLPRPGFLEGLRALCDRLGALLIFDEVKTCGKFYGGAEEAFGVRPDLKVFGKAIGGGYPISGVGGRKEVLDGVEPGVLSHAGTFNANPLVVTAAHVTLEKILTAKAMKGAARLGDALGKGYTDILADRRVPGLVQYRGISGALVFAPRPITDWRSFLDVDVGRWWGYYTAMLNRGVVPMALGPDEQWTLSVQHAKTDVETHLEAFDGMAAEIPAFRVEMPIVEAI